VTQDSDFQAHAPLDPDAMHAAAQQRGEAAAGRGLGGVVHGLRAGLRHGVRVEGSSP
jgi:hypothetical protein